MIMESAQEKKLLAISSFRFWTAFESNEMDYRLYFYEEFQFWNKLSH
jgi:hypothetical protein